MMTNLGAAYRESAAQIFVGLVLGLVILAVYITRRLR